MIEYERRFVVTGSQKPAVSGKPKRIQQGYLSATPGNSMRIRIVQDEFQGKPREYAVMGYKQGLGEARQEEEPPVNDLTLAKFLYSRAPHHVVKDRYIKTDEAGRRWEIDFFCDELQGLVLAEFEDDKPIGLISPPAWLGSAVDVTDSVSNAMLAQLATEIRQGVKLHEPLAQLLTRRVRRIVITGGPGSGKSTICRLLPTALPGNKIHVVPEVATILFGQLGVSVPTHDLGRDAFNRDLVNVQLAFERLAEIHCKERQLTSVVYDRGCMDNAAYHPEGLAGFVRSLGISADYFYSRYDLVICIGSPSEAVYNHIRANNPTRHETYPEAVERGAITRAVWQGHPNFHYEANDGPWEQTVQRVLARVT